jgi:S1/P1 Nuclease
MLAQDLHMGGNIMNRRTTMLVSMKPQFSAAAILAAALALNFSEPSPALAWFDQGHMTIAAAAYDQLTPAAKRRVAELLALNRYPTNGTNNASPDNAAKAAMAMAATAVDAIKKHRDDFKDDGEDPTDSAEAPEPGRNTGFDDKFMHKYWHYIDKPFSRDGTAVRSPPAINAQERIALFRRTIASDAPDELKAFDLVWLLHLVGDVHQPLHATSRFTEAKGDSGGNDVKLSCSGCPSELHRFWDDVLGTDDRVSTSMSAARLLPPADPTEAAIKDEATWIDESFRIAQDSVYLDPPIGNGTGPFALTIDYKNNAKRVALARAGRRSAREHAQQRT